MVNREIKTVKRSFNVDLNSKPENLNKDEDEVTPATVKKPTDSATLDRLSNLQVSDRGHKLFTNGFNKK